MELKKVQKTLAKLERKYETAGPIERARIEKKYLQLEKRLNRLKGE